MIRQSELTPVGRILKPHGIDGEMVVELTADIDLASLRCVVMDEDGIFVPFFIDSCRPRGAESALVHIDGISDDSRAAACKGRTLYALTAELPEHLTADDDNGEGFYLDDIVGYTVTDADTGQTVGEITDYDDSTANTLLMVTPPGKDTTVYIPVAGELIESVDPEARVIAMYLPEGLI